MFFIIVLPFFHNFTRKFAIVQFFYLRRFVDRRDDLNIESDDALDWEVKTQNHAKQLDSVNCGIYVIKVKVG